jgi:GH25 family lysozyme M1 (1,4-beta-N-acetylmuramidase)
MIKGADLSHYQGNIDFSVLKGNLDFVLIKATEGISIFDANYSTYVAGARSIGLSVGHYHFAHPEVNSAKAEADFFLTRIKPQDGEIVCLDFEIMSYSDPVNWSLSFLNEIYDKLGVKPLIYLNKSLVNGHDWSPVINNNNGLWLADYPGDPVNTSFTCKWPSIAIRQWSNGTAVPGIQYKVDMDTFYGDVPTFQKYGYNKGMELTQDQQNVLSFLATVSLVNGEIWNFGNYESLVRGGVGALSDKVSLQTQVSTLQTNDQTLSNHITSLESDLDTANSTIKSLRDEISTLTSSSNQPVPPAPIPQPTPVPISLWQKIINFLFKA